MERSPPSETSSNDVNIEDKLETRFEVNNKVYGGTYGEVWRATDLLTKENVVRIWNSPQQLHNGG